MDNNVLDKAYLKLRNDYIIPISKYHIPIAKVDYWDFKETILRSTKGMKSLSAKKFSIEIESEIFLKSMVAESEMFYSKTILQYNDYMRTKDLMSDHWKVVTLYYLNFYSVTTLFRLLSRGFSFFSDEYAARLSSIVTILEGEALNIRKGNYIFLITKNDIENQTLTVEFTQQDDVHKSTWSYLHEHLIPEIKAESRDYEKIVLTELLKMGKPSLLNIPSIVRNAINYQAKYGVDSMMGKITCYRLTNNINDVAYNIINFDESNSINNRIKNSVIYGNYFFLLMIKLHQEYLDRRDVRNDFVSTYKRYFVNTDILLP